MNTATIKQFFIYLFIGASLSACVTTSTQPTKPTYYVYLAGPEVFLPDPIAAGVNKKQKIAELSKNNNWPFELVGLYPMDNEIENFAPNRVTGLKIYDANIALMQKADFITANMVRFRGPSMDVGTAFEMGFMAGLNKPVFAYYDAKPFYGAAETPGLYADRVAKFYPVNNDKPGFDTDGQSIENFAMEDNLMMIGALADKDRVAAASSSGIASTFESVIMQIAEHLLKPTAKQ